MRSPNSPQALPIGGRRIVRSIVIEGVYHFVVIENAIAAYCLDHIASLARLVESQARISRIRLKSWNAEAVRFWILRLARLS